MKAFTSALLVSLVVLSDVAAFDDNQSAQALIYIGVPLGRTERDPAYSFGVRVDREQPLNVNRYTSPIARRPEPILDLHCGPDGEYSFDFDRPQDRDDEDDDVSQITRRLADRPGPVFDDFWGP